MTTSFEYRKLTQNQLLAEVRERFGDDPMDWAFTCPTCQTVTTGRELSDALKAYPRRNRNGDKTITSDLLGRECIGRTHPEMGCDWAAYGLFRGPWEVELPDGESQWCFPIADTAGGDS